MIAAEVSTVDIIIENRKARSLCAGSLQLMVTRCNISQVFEATCNSLAHCKFVANRN